MKERLTLLALNDLIELGMSLELEYSKEQKEVFIEKIYNALSKRTDTEQYEILKGIFTKGRFEVIYYKRLPSLLSVSSDVIIPKNKEALFSECIIIVEKEYIICAKKRLQNQSLTLTQARKSLKNNQLEGQLVFTQKIVSSTFLALINSDKFAYKWDKKYMALYYSYTAEGKLLTIHSKLSSNNEQIRKQIKNIPLDETSLDDLNINSKFIQDMDENERILINHFVTNYPKALSNKIKNTGVNILEIINNEIIRYKIILKSNLIFSIENIDTTLDDIKNVLNILIGLDNELRK